MRDESFLSIRDARKAFGRNSAVENVNLDIARGEFVTLLGPSGCGKTTLLRMIAGFEEPTAGRILLDGTDLTRLPPERRPLNMVFQSYALFPHMNVFDNVAYGLRVQGVPVGELERRVRDGLDLVGLGSDHHRPVHELSGGMSQRVALVRALVNEPSVLLLDEPLGALDLKLRKRMQMELRSIQDRLGTTFVYVTHDQEEALVLSHRVVVMNEGMVVQVGTPEDVYDRPRTRFVAEFVGETSLLPAVVEQIGNGQLVARLEGASVLTEALYVGPEPLTVGSSGLLAVRPEHVRLAGDRGELRGVVHDLVFIGSDIHALIRLDSGCNLRVECEKGNAPRRGDVVDVGLKPGLSAFVLEAKT